MSHSELVKKSRHRLEKPLFTLAAFLTIVAFALVFAVSIFKTETVQMLKDNAIEQYRMEYSEKAENLSDDEIYALLPAETVDDIDSVQELSTVFVVVAPLGLLLMMIYQIGKIYGKLKGDGVRVTERQFPKVYAMWHEMAMQLGMTKVPELYIQNGNGALNAFATCLPGYRAFGAIYSDILERALVNNDDRALKFILGHELGHIRLNHVAWWYHLLTFVGNLPFINFFVGLPLSRAREYGCDKVGHYLSGDDGRHGLMMLAAGKHLYGQINFADYQFHHIQEKSRWVIVHNFFLDHSPINWRIAAIQENRHGELFWR